MRHDVTPERLYERRWALLVLERVLASLRTEWEAAGKSAEFEGLKDSLLGQTTEGGYGRSRDRMTGSRGSGSSPGEVEGNRASVSLRKPMTATPYSALMIVRNSDCCSDAVSPTDASTLGRTGYPHGATLRRQAVSDQGRNSRCAPCARPADHATNTSITATANE